MVSNLSLRQQPWHHPPIFFRWSSGTVPYIPARREVPGDKCHLIFGEVVLADAKCAMG